MSALAPENPPVIERARQPYGFAVILLVTGLGGLLSSFELALDKIRLLEDPEATLSCNISPLVQCGKNLGSWQGAVFFDIPNPLIGLAAFAVPIVIAMAIFAGARFNRWFWWGFLAGTALGLAWVIWFISQSVFVLGTLCPWCMTMWVSMIPMFWATATWVVKNQTCVRGGAKKFADVLWDWWWVITVASYVVVAIVAQVGVNWLFKVFGIGSI